MVVGSDALMTDFFLRRVGDVGLADCLFFGDVPPSELSFLAVGELLPRVVLLK